MRHQAAIAPVAIVLAVAVALAAAWAGAAEIAYRENFSAGSAPARREACARAAQRIDPWSQRYRARVTWLAGDAALAAGDYNKAVVLLGEAYREDVGNRALLADFRRAQELQALETNRKAHLQHGHEGPGGTLAPGDVER
jgi:hypothetical protein